MLFISKTFPYSYCACVRNTPKIVTFVIEKMKVVSFSLFIDAFPHPLGSKCPLHMLLMFIARCRCPKCILGLGGGGGGGGKASKNKLKDTSFIFPMTNVKLLGVFRTHSQKEYGKVWKMKSNPILNILALLLF